LTLKQLKPCKKTTTKKQKLNNLGMLFLLAEHIFGKELNCLPENTGTQFVLQAKSAYG
jgi:hypothetical protein